MDADRERLTGWLHGAVALLSAWLILTSPWIAMLRRIPRDASWLDHSHVGLGFLTLLLSVTYLFTCTWSGRWRLYFPWIAGRLGTAARDLAGLLRGRIPTAEGGGLFAVIEGLTLLLLLATAVTGAAWFSSQGSNEALLWRGYHICAARGLAALIVVHVVTVSLHLLEFIRG
jgi:cytochrome b561